MPFWLFCQELLMRFSPKTCAKALLIETWRHEMPQQGSNQLSYIVWHNMYVRVWISQLIVSTALSWFNDSLLAWLLTVTSKPRQ